MSRTISTALILVSILLLPLPLGRADPATGEKLDPSIYLDEKAFEESKKDSEKDPVVDGVKQNVVQIDGRPYYKFGQGRAAIIVLKTDHLSKQEMERAVCVEDLKEVCDPNKGTDPNRRELCEAEGMQEAILARAEVALTDATVLYSGLILQTIQTTCGGGGVQHNAKDISSLLEIGVEWRSKDPRHPGSKKIFIRPLLTPQMGGAISF